MTWRNWAVDSLGNLAEKEQAEIDVLATYLPKQLTAEEIDVMIDEAIATVGMTGMAAMGKVMGMLKPKLTGRADMGQVSGMIKKKLMG